jgi:hypothetical protein
MMFDYAAPAKLFMPKRKGGARQRLNYRRFATAAEAIRFAVEELPAIRMLGPWMQVGDECFNSDDIRRLYESIELRRHRQAGEFNAREKWFAKWGWDAFLAERAKGRLP